MTINLTVDPGSLMPTKVHYPVRPLDENGKLILKLAINHIEEKGWCQGQPIDALGRVCAMQALNFAAHDLIPDPNGQFREADLAFNDVVHSLEDRINTSPNMMFLPLVHWNDSPRRTKAEVIKLFEETAQA